MSMVTVQSVRGFDGLAAAPREIPGPLDTLWAAITKPFQGTPSIGSPATSSGSGSSTFQSPMAWNASLPVAPSTPRASVWDDTPSGPKNASNAAYSPRPTATQAVMHNLSRTGGGSSSNTATLRPGSSPVVTSTVDEDYFNSVPARSGPVQQSVEEGGVGILPAIAAITSAFAPLATGLIQANAQKKADTAARHEQGRRDAAAAAEAAKTRQVVVRQQPFPWKPVLIGTGVVVGLGLGGYLLVKATRGGGGRRRNPHRRRR